MKYADGRKVLFFDTETTGLDPHNDAVIELSLYRMKGGKTHLSTMRFNTDVPIGHGAQKVHGITKADIEDKPYLKGPAAIDLHETFSQAQVFGGYNVKFDIDFMRAEFMRNGLSDPFEGKPIVDALSIWRASEPRDLTSAVKRFLGEDLEGAHAAEDDVMASLRVSEAMIEEFGLEDMTADEIYRFCNPEMDSWVGDTDHFVWEDGNIVFGFGNKHKGNAYDPDNKEHRGYLGWVLRADFQPSVKALVRLLLEDNHLENVVNVYGPPKEVENA